MLFPKNLKTWIYVVFKPQIHLQHRPTMEENILARLPWKRGNDANQISKFIT